MAKASLLHAFWRWWRPLCDLQHWPEAFRAAIGVPPTQHLPRDCLRSPNRSSGRRAYHIALWFSLHGFFSLAHPTRKWLRELEKSSADLGRYFFISLQHVSSWSWPSTPFRLPSRRFEFGLKVYDPNHVVCKCNKS